MKNFLLCTFVCSSALLPVGGVLAAEKRADSTVQATHQERVSAERLKKLVRQLGDKDFYVRQHAQEELSHAGFEAYDALAAATSDADLEVASRAKYLLRLMHVEWVLPDDPPEVKNCLNRYEFADRQTRLRKMDELARMPEGQGAVALCRLVRFEKSPGLSKQAALALLQRAQPTPATADAVRNSLAHCSRPGALWLLAWANFGADPQAVMAEWQKFVADEQRLPPSDTSPEILAGLIRFQVRELKKLGKTAEAMAAINRLVEVDRGTVESLTQLLRWLVEQKAWKAVDDLAQRYEAQFNADAVLTYALANAYQAEGKQDLAGATAKRAFEQNPGKGQQSLLLHLMAAHRLRLDGNVDWARREFEYVIAQDAKELRTAALPALAEMLHDQGQDLDAGETLQKLVAAMEAGKLTTAILGNHQPGETRARMNYFFACHWANKGDVAKQRQYLDKALKADSTDVDVLIACYHLPKQPGDFHAKIVNLIHLAAATFREEIAQEPENPALYAIYNQFAWLIGNTEGDFDEALRCARKAIELMPNEGGLYDTLAHVYFGKGDVDNAVKQQTKAAQLDPHSGLIRRKLEYFRKELEAKKKLSTERAKS